MKRIFLIGFALILIATPAWPQSEIVLDQAVDIFITDAGGIISATEVEGALQENRTAIDLNTTHKSSDGSDHTFIDQDVTTTGSPTFIDTTSKRIKIAPEASQSITAVTDTIASASGFYMISSNADYTMTSTPTITSGTDGQILMLHNNGSFEIVLQDDSVLTGSDVFHGGTSGILAPNETLTMIYSTTVGGWFTQSHPNLTGAATKVSMLAKVNEVAGISICDVVYVSGATGNRPQVSLASNDDFAKASIIGIAAETKTNGQNIIIILVGEQRTCDTSAFSAGEVIYLGTAGGITPTHPSGTTAVVKLGHATKSNASTGIVQFNVTTQTVIDTFDGIVRNSIVNESTGTSAVASITFINDAMHRGSVSYNGSSHTNGENFNLFNDGYGNTLNIIDGNKGYDWYTDVSDAHALAATLKMSLNAAGTLNLAGLTASEILITDGSKNIVSAAVATYPSLAELIHVKGVTSAIQTQIDTKGAHAGQVWTGIHDYGGATSVEIPNSATPTVNATGEIAVDSNGMAATHGSLDFYDGTQVLHGVGTTDTPADNEIPKYDSGTGKVTWEADAGGGSVEGTAVLSTGEVGGTKFLREDGDGTSSWQTPAGGGNVSNTGTPLNSQIAIWTDATTIEGAASFTYDGSNFFLTGDIGATGTRITKGWFTDFQVTNTIIGSINGNAATVTTITGLAPDTATTQAAQPNITSLGILTNLQVDNININLNTISSTAGTDLLITPLAGQQLILDGTLIIDAGVMTGATSITSTAFVGALTGNADTVTTITGLAPDTATTQATQAAITTASNLVTVGALGSGSIAAGFGAIDNGTSGIRTATFTAETAYSPDAAGGADLGTTLLEFNDLFLNDGGIIQLGNDQDVTITHVADTGIQIELDDKIMFGDVLVSVSSDDDGFLDLDADTGVRTNAPLTVGGAENYIQFTAGYTADPCTGAGSSEVPINSMFHNTTANETCWCNASGVDVRTKDFSTVCF